MAIFSRLHDKDAEIYKALAGGSASEGQQKVAAELILKEMTRADENAKKITHLNSVINGFERALAVIAR